MPKTYRKGKPEEIELLKEVLRRHHEPLHTVKVAIGMVFVGPARNQKGEITGPALTHGGYPVAGRIKLTTPHKRVLLPYDALIDVDEDWWDQAKPSERIAVLDHQCEHLELSPGTTNDLRPILSLRLHDWELGGFATVVERHGEAALERKAFAVIADRHGQLLLAYPGRTDTDERPARAEKRSGPRLASATG